MEIKYSEIIDQEVAAKIQTRLSDILLGGYDLKEQFRLVHNIFSWIVEALTSEEGIHFTTIFTRVAYLGTKYRLSSDLLYQSHQLRRQLEQSSMHKETIDLGVWVISQYIAKFSALAISKPLLQVIDDLDIKNTRSSSSKGFKRVISGLIIDIDEARHIATFIDESKGDVEEKIRFNLADRNELFTNNLLRAQRVFGNRFLVNLIDVEIDNEDYLRPKAFVIMPDYLMDVSSIAECFSYNGIEPVQYLLRKLLPSESSIHMILGNIVNFILDRLCDDLELQFEELIPDIFHLYPLAFAKMKNDDLRELLQKAELHFDNLKQSIDQDFSKQNIDRNHVYLEPSFYTRDYGLQGRLDVFHHAPVEDKADIIELKSGKTFRPNVYGINANHYIQTLCYDLIIRSVYRRSLSLNNYILYSSVGDQSLKYAPSVAAQQYEALQVRNHLVLQEFILERVDRNEVQILEAINTVALPGVKGYVQRDISRIEKIFRESDPLLLAYYKSFLGFVSREHHLAKIGEHGEDKNNGLASLWLETTEQKRERFAMLESLEIIENRSAQDPALLKLRQQAVHRKLSSFRVGDIVVFYPKDGAERSVLRHQIFKCNILEINDVEIVIKLRSKQNNQQIFRQFQYWNLEPDFLDSSFNMMNRALFQYLEASTLYQRQILTLTPPRNALSTITLPHYPITEEQGDLLRQMLSTQDYYLLWGPPGTGKTSYLLKYASQYLVEESEQHILLLAYTNRAVDQICAAMESIDSIHNDGYIRIGSAHATDAAYRHRLLHMLIKDMHSRKAINALLKKTKVIVSTVSSIHSRSDIFDLKKFDTIIVDEASQILEPMLVGLLSRVKKYILIGDHRQLPAVVVQEPNKTKVGNAILKEIGLKDLRDSLFERMYIACVKNEWTHAYGIIKHQGRMHHELMRFPNEHFYQNKLNVISHIDRLMMDFGNGEGDNSLKGVLASRRLIYIDTPIDDEFNIKTNLYEALLVSKLIDQLQAIYRDRSVQAEIGVITPYKAQIAQVMKQLDNDEIDHEDLSIDTVERYQGSARDIIIISLCTNAKRQIHRLSQETDEGVDRKLNVALTRAKEQIIILGNEKLLSHSGIYSRLINSYYRYDYSFS